MGTKIARIEAVREVLGLNKTQMAELLGIDRSYYQHIIAPTPKANLRIEHLERLYEKYEISPLWVLTGQGSMYLREDEIEWNREPTEEQINEIYAQLPAGDLSVKDSIKMKFLIAQWIYENHETSNTQTILTAANIFLTIMKHKPDFDFDIFFDDL